jgi:cell division transport system ATP-binding protein
MIKFSHVYKVYERDIKALEDVSFTITKGEFVFITGPSGAGKSTVFNLLYRDETADMGTIFVDNSDIAHLKGGKIPFYRRRIGFVFQDFKLLFDRSIFENVALPLVITGASDEFIKRAVKDSLKRIGLDDRETLNPWHLSGGEKQKTAIARAMILNPPVILADEPTGNLDEESSWQIMSMFDELNKKGTTVIVASHNKEIVAKMNKRVIRLEKGKVVSDALG